ncbi:MAG TPA: BA14K family protein [Caulobacterales bacterium]|nr:BA14K family protein [Caulobacterales bacterium]
MKRLITNAVAALMLSTTLAAAPAMAQGPGPGPDHRQPPPGHELRAPPPPNTQWNRGHEPPPYWGERNWEYRQRYLRRHDHDENDHDSTAGLIAGVILGFVLGAAVTDSQERQAYAQSHRDDRTWNDSCARRYRSFDPYSGTYLGTDGLRHYCR